MNWKKVLFIVKKYFLGLLRTKKETFKITKKACYIRYSTGQTRINYTKKQKRKSQSHEEFCELSSPWYQKLRNQNLLQRGKKKKTSAEKRWIRNDISPTPFTIPHPPPPPLFQRSGKFNGRRKRDGWEKCSDCGWQRRSEAGEGWRTNAVPLCSSSADVIPQFSIDVGRKLRLI